jgi:hypothetical protein
MAAKKRKRKWNVQVGDATLDEGETVPMGDTVPFGTMPPAGDRNWRVRTGDASIDPGVSVEIGEPMVFQDKYGAVEPGNMDLANRPYVWHDDGSASTVRSMGVDLDEPGGLETLVPTVSNDGRLLTADEAIEEFYRTGQHMGRYSSPEASTRAGEEIHLDQMRNPPKNTLARLDGQRTVPYSAAGREPEVSVEIGEPVIQVDMPKRKPKKKPVRK